MLTPLPQSPGTSTDDALHVALRERFGFRSFHPGQQEVIADVLAGRPTLAVMPTGAGKSLCYQLPALLLEGVTLVISPLIALMKDQVDALRQRDIAAAALNSSLTSTEQRWVIDELRAGGTRLLYVAPERFRHEGFVRALESVRVSLFAIDEAHCISRWGHDFRPDYLRLGRAMERCRPDRLLACTATATEEVREDIVSELRMEEPQVHVAGFLRDNLFLELRICSGDKEKGARLSAALRRHMGDRGAAIVYAATRKRVEQFASGLRGALGDEAVVHYHAGMGDAERTQAQDRFMSGAARVAVATNAFGMGVDRADVRVVAHADMPGTIEAYYQEVGRAGRDGEPARCVLFFNPVDTRIQEFLIELSHPPPEVFADTWAAVRDLSTSGPASLQEIARAAGLRSKEGAVETALRMLSRTDAVLPSLNGYQANPDAPAELRAAGLDLDEVSRHHRAELRKLQRVKRLILSRECRHRYVLGYFGERFTGPCPGCDRCSGGSEPGLTEGEPAGPTGPAGPEETLVVRKALSGVARARHFGLKKVAGMLAGSKSQEVMATRLPNLSTYGILSELGLKGCTELLRLLVDRGLCCIGGLDYPILQLTPVGGRVMRGQEQPELSLPERLCPAKRPKKKKKKKKGSSLSPDQLPPDADGNTADMEVYAALKAFRTAEASRRRVPPYVVFNNRALEGLARACPTDEEEFLAVLGLGPDRWERIGPRVLEIIAETRSRRT